MSENKTVKLEATAQTICDLTNSLNKYLFEICGDRTLLINAVLGNAYTMRKDIEAAKMAIKVYEDNKERDVEK